MKTKLKSELKLLKIDRGLKLTIKTPELRVDVVLVSLLLTLANFTPFSSISTVDFSLNVCWV